jgi:hypothetical protein
MCGSKDVVAFNAIINLLLALHTEGMTMASFDRMKDSAVHILVPLEHGIDDREALGSSVQPMWILFSKDRVDDSKLEWLFSEILVSVGITSRPSCPRNDPCLQNDCVQMLKVKGLY